MAIKKYYHPTKGARFIFKSGNTVYFSDGSYSTEDVEEQKELDAVVKLGAISDKSAAEIEAKIKAIRAAAAAEAAKNAQPQS